MGILNVTPDSFSDGGLYLDFDAAISHAAVLWSDGADVIDVGGESTRPGAESVPVQEELARVMPVIEKLVDQGIRVSVDTSKPAVAETALRAGAWMVNDVTGLRDPEMIEVCAANPCQVAIMHMQGSPTTMQSRPTYVDVVRDVRESLVHAASLAEAAGIPRNNLWVDPGIGFGKTVQQNLQLIKHLNELVRVGYPVMIGVSNKSFIGRILGSDNEPVPIRDRLEGTLAAEVYAVLQGARMIRTHRVRSTVRALDLALAIHTAE